jgi:hypothetical protein
VFQSGGGSLKQRCPDARPESVRRHEQSTDVSRARFYVRDEGHEADHPPSFLTDQNAPSCIPRRKVREQLTPFFLDVEPREVCLVQ